MVLWTIRVKTLNSELVHSLAVEHTCTIPDLKQEVHSKTGVASDKQRLIFQGKVLKNDKSLKFYSIKDGVTIHMVERRVTNSTSNTNSSRVSRTDGHRAGATNGASRRNRGSGPFPWSRPVGSRGAGGGPSIVMVGAQIGAQPDALLTLVRMNSRRREGGSMDDPGPLPSFVGSSSTRENQSGESSSSPMPPRRSTVRRSSEDVDWDRLEMATTRMYEQVSLDRDLSSPLSRRLFELEVCARNLSRLGRSGSFSGEVSHQFQCLPHPVTGVRRLDMEINSMISSMKEAINRLELLRNERDGYFSYGRLARGRVVGAVSNLIQGLLPSVRMVATNRRETREARETSQPPPSSSSSSSMRGFLPSQIVLIPDLGGPGSSRNDDNNSSQDRFLDAILRHIERTEESDSNRDGRPGMSGTSDGARSENNNDSSSDASGSPVFGSSVVNRLFTSFQNQLFGGGSSNSSSERDRSSSTEPRPNRASSVPSFNYRRGSSASSRTTSRESSKKRTNSEVQASRGSPSNNTGNTKNARRDSQVGSSSSSSSSDNKTQDPRKKRTKR
mmetsp:Transcript_9861/g.16136  ORF Transcript_9861/g.16136 Transcript_9861/m.16136 type:complete len:557 (-) Transcript_9861:1032-2702(-)